MLSLARDLRSSLRSIRQNDFYWRFGANLAPTVHHLIRSNKGKSGGRAASLVKRLHTDGVAIARIEDIIDDRLMTRLGADTNILLATRTDDIQDMKTTVERDLTVGKKTFNLELLGSEPEFDADSIFAKLALSRSLLSIANGYLRMTAQLRYYNVWYTTASDGASRESQLWHYDREDNFILKVFLYLNDVDEGAGPFTYAPGTHRNGEYRSIQPEFFREGNVRRTTDEQMARVYPKDKWKVCTGKKGTIIFADTRGYHKGGEARTSDRFMFTCMYTSPASRSKDLIRFPTDVDLAGLSPEQVRALRIHQK